MLSWSEGRQGTGYYKMKLLESKWLKFDVYLLKFPKDSYIDWHIDEVPDHEHHRINIIKYAKKGGMFKYCRKGQITEHRKSFCRFRPDIEDHKVTRIEDGTRYVLSIGWLRRKNVRSI